MAHRVLDCVRRETRLTVVIDRTSESAEQRDLAPRVRESVKPLSITQRWLRADTVRVTFESAIGD